MSEVNVYGNCKTSAYYGEGDYCLLAKIKKAMFTRPNEVRATFRLISNGKLAYKKNDYNIYVNTQDGSTVYSLFNLDRKIDVKCHLRQDTNYLYIYTEKVELGYEVIMQLLSCSNLSLPHIEFVHYGTFSNTLLGDTEIVPTTANVPTVLSPITSGTPTSSQYKLENSWVPFATDHSFVRIDGDMVYINLYIKNGLMGAGTTIVTGLPNRESSETAYLRFPAIYKDTDNLYKPCQLVMYNNGALQITGMTLNNNAELICSISYRRKFEW